MPTDELSWLTDAQSKKAWLYEHLSYFDVTNRSGSSILGELRDRGFAIRTSRFYDALETIRGYGAFSDDIRGLNPGALIPENRHIVGHGLTLSWERLYRGTLLLRDLKTGEITMQTTSLGSNERLSTGEIESQIRERFLTAGSDRYKEVLAFTPFSALVRPE